MYKIAICDDEELQSTPLEKMIDTYMINQGLEVDIDIYSSGESLLRGIRNQEIVYQMIFLDIEMDGINGIETAKFIRESDQQVLLNYITSFDDYTLQSFEVSPFRYLLKPVKENEIRILLDAAVDKISSDNQYLFVKVNRTQYQVRCDQIIRITSEKGRKLRITMCNNQEDIVYYARLKDIIANLGSSIFVQVNYGTIINLNYIERIEDTIVHLTNGDQEVISRGKKKKFVECYRNFIERSLGI